MSGNRFRAISVGQSALPLCIRRVAGHKLHTAQKLHARFVAEVFYVSAKKVYPFLKAVQLRAARRKLHAEFFKGINVVYHNASVCHNDAFFQE